MTTLIRKTPYSEIGTFLDSFEKNLDSLWSTTSATPFLVPMDVFEKGDALFLRAAVPGVSPEAIELNIQKDVITLSGEFRNDYEGEDAKVYRKEHRYGKFSRSVRIPEGYALDQATAEFTNGLLTVRLPRIEPVQPEVKRIPIESRNEVN